MVSASLRQRDWLFSILPIPAKLVPEKGCLKASHLSGFAAPKHENVGPTLGSASGRGELRPYESLVFSKRWNGGVAVIFQVFKHSGKGEHRSASRGSLQPQSSLEEKAAKTRDFRVTLVTIVGDQNHGKLCRYCRSSSWKANDGAKKPRGYSMPSRFRLPVMTRAGR